MIISKIFQIVKALLVCCYAKRTTTDLTSYGVSDDMLRSIPKFLLSLTNEILHAVRFNSIVLARH